MELLVVGAGPVGLSAALAARAHGLSVTLLEAESADRVRPGGRALFVHGQTLRLLEAMRPGLGSAIAEFGVVWRRRRTFFRGREVHSRIYPEPKPGLPPFTSLRQVDTERFLHKACVEAGVDIVWDARVESVESTDRVSVTCSDGRTWSADYLIGADGARSAVRSAMKIPLAGNRSDDYHVAVDMYGEIDERVFHYHHRELDGRHVMIVPFAGGRQVDVQCRSQQDAEALAGETAEWLPKVGGPGEVMWVSSYPFLQRVAETFVKDRVLLAGEAAHLFSPLGARGMNSGIADADAAVRAVVEASTSSYDVERRAAAYRNRDATMAATAHMNAPSLLMKARQEGAALLAPVVPRFGAWLDGALYGPRNGGKY
ncbi:putative monooxygenase [Lentzea sp. NBRC 105346]|uniref:FAD-dependent oxidoreductase n=1 Tax=Lentzea sp. NBRC 105346 TaxID=3032205 RepID=UPI0024A002B1|nr:NAD(P)/FAD-dependent oxidoreductase [Lentzea sp. NBRC 105346]GLZ28700.1 putative monooxygenase [Lentzea sp. NBRC 105346]